MPEKYFCIKSKRGCVYSNPISMAWTHSLYFDMQNDSIAEEVSEKKFAVAKLLRAIL
jgi:hypothetical protein